MFFTNLLIDLIAKEFNIFDAANLIVDIEQKEITESE